MPRAHPRPARATTANGISRQWRNGGATNAIDGTASSYESCHRWSRPLPWRRFAEYESVGDEAYQQFRLRNVITLQPNVAGESRNRKAPEPVSESSHEQLPACSRRSVTDIGVTRETRLVTFWWSVNQRKREFGPEILGSEANLEGSSRTPDGSLANQREQRHAGT